MTYLYVDTSALVKTLRAEEETVALREHLAATSDLVVTSELTITELHRAAGWCGLPPAEAERRLQEMDLVPLSRSQMLTTGLLPDPSEPVGARLSGADAVHLADAIAVECTTVLTYDRDQSRAAASLGMLLVHPGRPERWYR